MGKHKKMCFSEIGEVGGSGSLIEEYEETGTLSCDTGAGVGEEETVGAEATGGTGV